ncbi:DHH family phosphoesterase [Sulfurimonas sp.]|uniref:DHH family phosphoesterase n=1 Tax=Sulfurimonas sp. TaxID=2022749 RepID=UPI003D0CC5B5
MNEIVEKIERAEHIVLISHVHPDGDSLGSASAMYSYLLQKHKKVSWFCATKEIHQRFSCIPWIKNVKNSYPFGADLAISLDCANKERLGVEVACTLVNIDHHCTNTSFGSLNLVRSSALSTTEILYSFFKENGVKINKKMATALYVGLLEDSEGFLGESVDGTTFAIVQELITQGAEFQLCNKKIMKSTSLAALRLKAAMLKDMVLEHSTTIAFFGVSYEDMKQSGAVAEDAEGALEESLFLPHVQVALLLRQRSDLSIKGSLRSDGSVDCASIALHFGGGGHLSRAGFVLKEGYSLQEAKEKVLSLIKKEIIF